MYDYLGGTGNNFMMTYHFEEGQTYYIGVINYYGGSFCRGMYYIRNRYQEVSDSQKTQGEKSTFVNYSPWLFMRFTFQSPTNI